MGFLEVAKGVSLYPSLATKPKNCHEHLIFNRKRQEYVSTNNSRTCTSLLVYAIFVPSLLGSKVPSNMLLTLPDERTYTLGEGGVGKYIYVKISDRQLHDYISPETFALICHQCSTLDWQNSVRHVLVLEYLGSTRQLKPNFFLNIGDKCLIGLHISVGNNSCPYTILKTKLRHLNNLLQDWNQIPTYLADKVETNTKGKQKH